MATKQLKWGPGLMGRAMGRPQFGWAGTVMSAMCRVYADMMLSIVQFLVEMPRTQANYVKPQSVFT